MCVNFSNLILQRTTVKKQFEELYTVYDSGNLHLENMWFSCEVTKFTSSNIKENVCKILGKNVFPFLELEN